MTLLLACIICTSPAFPAEEGGQGQDEANTEEPDARGHAKAYTVHKEIVNNLTTLGFTDSLATLVATANVTGQSLGIAEAKGLLEAFNNHMAAHYHRPSETAVHEYERIMGKRPPLIRPFEDAADQDITQFYIDLHKSLAWVEPVADVVVLKIAMPFLTAGVGEIKVVESVLLLKIGRDVVGDFIIDAIVDDDRFLKDFVSSVGLGKAMYEQLRAIFETTRTLND